MIDLVEKKRAFYNRLENDFDFRMNQVDKKIMTLNALAGFNKFMRYQTNVIEHNYLGEETEVYLISIHGQFKK